MRGQATLASCREGGHAIWWTVEASGTEEALALLPAFVAVRTEANQVSQVEVP